MKLPPITGKISEVRKVEQRKNGFNQVVIIHKPEVLNEQGYKLSKEQFYVVQIYSNKKDDSRFLPIDQSEVIGANCTAIVYMDAHRWTNQRGGTEYNNRLNLDKWVL
jgi:hypothetical protein